MFIVRVLNSDYSVNKFDEINEKNFIPGEATTLVMRLYSSERELRYIPGASAEINVKLLKSDGTFLEKDATLDSDDRSIFYVALSSSETSDLLGGNIVAEVDLLGDESLIETGFGYGVLRKVITT